MTYWNAALLGLVQGLAEFLPISSSGHLAVLQNFLAIGDMENHMLFDVLLHLGTLAAVILAFWKDVREVVTEFLRMLHLRRTPRGFERSFAVKFSFLLSIPAVVGANLVSIIKVFSTGVEWSYVPMYLVGVVCAFVSGYFAIYFLRLIVQRGKFGGFCYYCWGAGLVTLLLSLIS